MKVLAVIGLLVSETLYSQPGLTWARQVSASEHVSPIKIVCDQSGNNIIVGIASGTVDFDPGLGTSMLSGTGGYISKYNSSGVLHWAMFIGEEPWPNLISPWDAWVDKSGAIYVTGIFRGGIDMDPGPGTCSLTSGSSEYFDVFIVKYTLSGSFVWAKSLGGIVNTYGYAIATDNSGNVYIAGAFMGTLDFDPGPGIANQTKYGGHGFFLLKLDASGNYQWVKVTSDNNLENRINDITVDDAGNIYATGFFDEWLDFDFGPGTNALYGSDDVFVFKLDASGNSQWATREPTSAYTGHTDVGTAIALDSDNNVYVTGVYGVYGTYPDFITTLQDGFLCKLKSNGSVEWIRSTVGASFEDATSVAVASGGHVFVCGNGRSVFDADPGSGVTNIDAGTYVIEFDPTGNFVCAGSIAKNNGTMITDNNNNVIITGQFNGEVDFDMGQDTAMINTNSKDMYLCRYSACGFSTHLDENADYSLLVYPNPTEGIIRFDNSFSSNEIINIYNVTGEKVTHLEPSFNFVDIRDLPDGLYLLEVKKANAVYFTRVVKK